MRISGKIMRLALKCKADKKDVRSYLTGITISKNGFVFSSNSYVAFVSRQIQEITDEKLKNSIGISIIGTIRKEALYVDINISEKNIKCYNKNNELTNVVYFTIIDCKDIDFKDIVSKHKSDQSGNVTIDSKYLSYVSAFENSIISARIGAKTTPSLICSKDGVMIIMPCTNTPIDIPSHLAA